MRGQAFAFCKVFRRDVDKLNEAFSLFRLSFFERYAPLLCSLIQAPALCATYTAAILLSCHAASCILIQPASTLLAQEIPRRYAGSCGALSRCALCRVFSLRIESSLELNRNVLAALFGLNKK